MSWQHTLREAWHQRSGLARLLWPVSAIVSLIVRQRLRQARSQAPERCPLPVVIVGNVVAGGAGKTPTTLALAADLRARGESPVIVSKGHGRQGSPRTPFVVHKRMGAEQVGDEPLLMGHQAVCPVVVTHDRRQAVDWVVQTLPEATVLLFDDGLQDTDLAADAEVVLFDARGLGNAWLLPAGPLREPWPRRTWRRGCKTLHLLTTAAHEAAPELGDLDGPLWWVTRSLKPVVRRLDDTVHTNLSQLAPKPAQALAAIAKPEQFFTMLRAAGLQLRHTHALDDHAPLHAAHQGLDRQLPLLVTAKDAVKLSDWPADWQAQTWVVELDFALPPGLCASVAETVRQRRADLSSHHGQNTA